MQNLLLIRSSVNGSNSISNQFADELVVSLQNQFPNLTVLERDLDKAPIPVLSSATISAIVAGQTDTLAKSQASALSMTLIDELKSVDAIVMGVPMYNFSVPATLKSYVDYIARPKVTFAYSEEGPKGLLPNIPVYAFIACAGVKDEPDLMSPWLQQALGFIGLKNVNIVKMEGFVQDPTVADKVFAKTRQRIDEIASSYQKPVQDLQFEQRATS